MTWLLNAFIVGVGISFSALCGARGYKKGYRHGYDAGVEEGLLQAKRMDADWWISLEKGVDREQQKLWETRPEHRGDPDS